MKEAKDLAFERYKQEHDWGRGVTVCESRTNKGLSRRELAKWAQVSVLWIQQLETNRLHTNYLIRRLDQVARALGVVLFDLYKRPEDMIGRPPWPKTEGT
jgi:transcriptional regulator with XRE-family HTH domain